MYSNIIVDKSFDFSVKIIKFYKVLINIKKEYIIGKQFLRSGTSIGANVKEGIKAISRADFRNKMSIALKEANECEYWLELMVKSEIVSKDEVYELLEDCKELCKILSSIVKTTRQCSIFNDRLSMKDDFAMQNLKNILLKKFRRNFNLK